MQTSLVPAHQQLLITEQQSGTRSGNPSGGTFAEMIRFMREERAEMEAKLEKQQLDTEATLATQRKEADAKLEKQREETESLREQARIRTASEAISEEQLEALQSRLVALNEAKLLTDEESDTAEDITIDCLELLAKAPMTTLENPAVDKVRTMIVLSEKVAADRAFARQLRRKVL